MIKGKPSYPFETIALAVAFSPRLEALIAEMKRFASLFNARVIFSHIGKRSAEKESHLRNILSHYGFNETNSDIEWEDGEAVESILAVCKRNVVDRNRVRGAVDAVRVVDDQAGLDVVGQAALEAVDRVGVLGDARDVGRDQQFRRMARRVDRRGLRR